MQNDSFLTPTTDQLTWIGTSDFILFSAFNWAKHNNSNFFLRFCDICNLQYEVTYELKLSMNLNLVFTIPEYFIELNKMVFTSQTHLFICS
jgi:hypothetical protein